MARTRSRATETSTTDQPAEEDHTPAAGQDQAPAVESAAATEAEPERSVWMREPGGATVIVRESAVQQRLNAGWFQVR